MIRQYLPQTNENDTVVKSKKFSYLNKALKARVMFDVEMLHVCRLSWLSL